MLAEKPTFWPRLAILALCLGLVMLLGLIDFFVGWELSFSIFYLPPIVLATWRLGKRAGLAVAVFSTSVWLLADLLAGAMFSHPFVPYWNAAVRFGFFFITLALVSNHKDSVDQIKALALVDSLTGLANSRSFYALTEAEVARSRRYNVPLSIAYLDIDNFKGINDRFGHEKGDEVLQDVARIMKANIRQLDTAARLGGDEFAILLPGTDEAGAHVLLSRLHGMLAEMAYAKAYPIGFSIGVAGLGQTPTSVAAVLQEADKQMYRVKRQKAAHAELAL